MAVCSTVAGVGRVWVIVKWGCHHLRPALLGYDFLLTPDKAWPRGGTVVTGLLPCCGGAASLGQLLSAFLALAATSDPPPRMGE